MIVNLCLAIASGCLLVFAYPKWNVNVLVWVWIFPLLHALWQEWTQRRPLRRGFALGYVGGLSFFIPNLSWVRHSSRVLNGATDDRWMGWSVELMGIGALLGLSAYLALYWGLWGMLTASLGRPRIAGMGTPLPSLWRAGERGIPKPSATKGMFGMSLESLRSAFFCSAAWVGTEWLRGVVFTGFGWNGLAIPLASDRAMIQSADMVGVTGLSFLPIFSACILYNTVLRFMEEVRTSRVRPHVDFFVGVALVLANFIYGFNILSVTSHAPTVALRVLVVQQNISLADRWAGKNVEKTYQGYGDLTHVFMASPRPPDLVVWPEAALIFPFHDPNHIPFLNDVLKSGDFSLLTGTDIIEPQEPAYTGAALMKGTFDNNQLYRKVHLVPFGEYLPLRNIGIVRSLLGGIIPGDFAFGSSTEPLTLEKPAGVEIIPLICFEDTVGSLARKFVREAPQIMVNMTNDGWFLHSAENEVHLANALFRCVELRRPMARAANTGVSCFISDTGKVDSSDRLQDKANGSVFIKGALPREVNLVKEPKMTFYAKHGDVFSVAMLIAAVGMVAAKLLMARFGRSSATAQG